MRYDSKSSNTDPVALPRVYRGAGMRIVSVTGGKGGVGKSSIAVNLAIALSRLGGRVMLLDGDLGLANADQMLGVHAPATLWDVMRGQVDLPSAILDTPHGISLLPAASGRQEMAELSETARADLIRGVKDAGQRFDYVVVDTAAGIGETALSLAGAGDIILAVATPDPTSVRDAFSIMKLLSQNHKVDRMSLVANMVGSRQEGLGLFKQISSVTGRFLPLSLGLAGHVVRDPSIQRAIMERRPLLAAYPGSPASKQIQDIATHIITSQRDPQGSGAPGRMLR